MNPTTERNGMDFGTKMRVLRAARGWSQTELSERTGITNTILSIIETGKLIPSPYYEKKIRDALGWDDDTEAVLAMLTPATEQAP